MCYHKVNFDPSFETVYILTHTCLELISEVDGQRIKLKIIDKCFIVHDIIQYTAMLLRFR